MQNMQTHRVGASASNSVMCTGVLRAKGKQKRSDSKLPGVQMGARSWLLWQLCLSLPVALPWLAGRRRRNDDRDAAAAAAAAAVVGQRSSREKAAEVLWRAAAASARLCDTTPLPLLQLPPAAPL